MIELAICPHSKETVKTSDGSGILVSTCTGCNQVLQYKEGERDHGTILRVGRIGEAVVLPGPGTPLDVTPTEWRLVSEGFMLKASMGLGNGRKRSKYSGVSKPHHSLEIESGSASKGPALVISPEPVESAEINGKERVKMATSRGRGKYNEVHREEILADRVTMGHLPAMEKHGIKPSTWNGLRTKWRARGFEVPDMRPKRGRKVGSTKALVPSREEEDIDWKAQFKAVQSQFDGYRQAVRDIFGTKGE